MGVIGGASTDRITNKIQCLVSFLVIVVVIVEESREGKYLNPLVCFCLPKETYHRHLSSITTTTTIAIRCTPMRLI